MNSKNKTTGWIFFALFVGTVYLANFLISHVGIQFSPTDPHVIPVGFGLMAPSGVLAAGLAFTLRDLVQRSLGAFWAAIAILLGAVLSIVISPSLALASGGAFFVSEFLDLLVYTPIHKKNVYVAVIASNTVGLVVDSVVFLGLAFGSLAFLPGQVVGKIWMTLIALPIVWVLHQYDKAHPEPQVAVKVMEDLIP